MMLDALATLPPKARVAVVMMRYWADLSVDQVAELPGCSAARLLGCSAARLLGCSPGTVKSQSARALALARSTSCGRCSTNPARSISRWTNGIRRGDADRTDPDRTDPDMNGTTLSAMLDRAIADEPLIGPVAQNALQAGIRRRGRRRTGDHLYRRPDLRRGNPDFDRHEQGRTAHQGREVPLRHRDYAGREDRLRAE